MTKALVMSVLASLFGWGLSGCADTPAKTQVYQVEAHGETLADARQQAMDQARARCQGGDPVVLDSNAMPTGPVFTDTSDIPPSQSEVADYAATTHEGERPIVRWRYRCQ